MRRTLVSCSTDLKFMPDHHTTCHKSQTGFLKRLKRVTRDLEIPQACLLSVLQNRIRNTVECFQVVGVRIEISQFAPATDFPEQTANEVVSKYY